VTQSERLPSFLPVWVRERIEVNVYKLKRFVRDAALHVPLDARVLDAGAGEGRFHRYFAHARYVGVDFADGDADWDYSGLDAIANLVRLPFRDAVFDVAVCTQVLEHVSEPLQVLCEIRRVLKPGGRLYLSAPQSWHQHQKPHDYYRYTSFGLRHLIERSGLQVESVQALGGYFWFLSFQLQNLVYWTFSHRSRRHRWLTWPLRAVLGFVFQLVLPLLLFYLDGLDRVQDETFGHACIAIRPADEMML
jgi:SAM-dependent methyltransferase